MTHLTTRGWHVRKGMLVASALLLMLLLLSACGGDPQTQQKADHSKYDLDSTIAHAQSIGVPDSILQPIVQQEQQISATSAPIGLFSSQPVADYYTNLSQRYEVLAVQVRGLEIQTTEQFHFQAYSDIQDMEQILAQRQAQGFVEAKTFSDQLANYQNQLAQAQYPKDFLQLSTSVQNSSQALRLMGPAYNALTSFQQSIQQLKASHLDTTAFDQQAKSDLDAFRNASSPDDYSQLIDQINAQLQETTVFSTQAIPYVGAAKLSQFSADIDLTKQYGQDVTTFQQRLTADKASLNQAKSIGDFLKVSAQIDKDIASIQFPMIQGKASYLLKQFHQEVANWGNTHQYHNSYDGGVYNLDYEYDQQGIGSDADTALLYAQTLDDYQGVVDLVNNDLANLHAMEADYGDKTAWNQVHATDTQLMKYYNVTSGRVLVVSLIEQTLRVYQDGKLIKSFLITTGQYAKPSVPGFWHIFYRASPTKFTSSEPKGSAFWYPDTKINYAMEYHDGGYFFHDSWWRADYGPGTNFPHYDSGGDEAFAGNGSHGCVNMQEDQAGWLYANSGYGDAVIMY